MPELPEVETMCRMLRSCLDQGAVTRVLVRRPEMITCGIDRLHTWAGQRLSTVERIGKQIHMRVTGPNGHNHALIHLGMTGQFRWSAPLNPQPKHAHIIWIWNQGTRQLTFEDARRFGAIQVLSDNEWTTWKAQYTAMDPLNVPWGKFWPILKASRQHLKPWLMDQHILGGVGNIYASEILHAARLHPTRTGHSLSEQEGIRLLATMGALLTQAIRAGGSTIHTYRTPTGTTGAFQLHHQVYGREGEPCYRGCPSWIQASRKGRTTFWCPTCQH